MLLRQGAENQMRSPDAYVAAALTRKHRPCRNDVEGQIPVFIEVSEGGAQ